MIDKVEAGKTYRLIDKQGYFDAYFKNRGLYDNHFTEDGTIRIDSVIDNGRGMLMGVSTVIITKEEFKFFELVGEDETIIEKYPLGKPDYSARWYMSIKDSDEYYRVKTVLCKLGCNFDADMDSLSGYIGINSSGEDIMKYDYRTPIPFTSEQVDLLGAINLLFPQDKSKKQLQKEELSASIVKMEAELAQMKQQVEKYND